MRGFKNIPESTGMNILETMDFFEGIQV